MSYNGWKNYETWNVALWILNDEGLYLDAKKFRRLGYTSFAQNLLSEGCKKTPDGVAWNDAVLDIAALDETLSEL